MDDYWDDYDDGPDEECGMCEDGWCEDGWCEGECGDDTCCCLEPWVQHPDVPCPQCNAGAQCRVLNP